MPLCLPCGNTRLQRGGGLTVSRTICVPLIAYALGGRIIHAFTPRYELRFTGSLVPS